MAGFSKVSEAVGNNHAIILAIGNDDESLVKDEFSKIFNLDKSRIYCSTPVVSTDSATGAIGTLPWNQGMLFVVKTREGLEYFASYLDLLRKNSFQKLTEAEV